MLAPGTHVGRYTIVAPLGAGGMGVVYEARDPELDRPVAIKLVRPDASVDAAVARHRLMREAQAMARLSHPNVVPVHDVGTHDGAVFLTMELVAGETARAWLAHRPRGWREIVALFVQAGGGLAAAHRAGIVHRDFKPDNVLVGRDGRIRVTDFGLARSEVGAPDDAPVVAEPAVASITATGTVLGTLAYMAPEQHMQRAADARSDQFAFCVSLYEAVYGERPFACAGGDLPTALALAVEVTAGRVQPAPRDTRVPAALRRLLVRGLAADPEQRHPSVDAVLHELRRLLRARRRRLLIAGAIATLAAIAVAVWLARATAGDGARRPPALRRTLLTGGEETISSPPAALPARGGVVFASDRAGPRQLYWVDADGRDQVQLTRGGGGAAFPHLAGDVLCWLRGDPAAYDLVCAPMPAVRAAIDAGGGGRGDLDGAAQVVRVGVGHAVRGARGELLVADAPLHDWGGPREVWVESATGERRAVGFPDGLELRWAVWSPDGARAAAIARAPGDHHGGDAWLIDPATGDVRAVAEQLVAAAGVTFTADGRALLAVRGHGAERQLVRIPVDGGAETAVATARGGLMPAVSRDGAIVYVEDATDWGLWIAKDGSLRRVTFTGEESALSPAWTSDGSALMYGVERAGAEFALVRVASDDFTRELARRAIAPPTSTIAFSGDGRRALYGVYRGDDALLELVELDTEEPPRTLVRRPRPVVLLTPQLLAGDRIGWVEKAGPDGAYSIWEANADGSEPRRLLDDGFNGARTGPGGWMVVGRTDGAATGMHVVRLDAAGAPTGPLAPIAGERPIRGVSFHPLTGALLVVDAAELAQIDPVSGARDRVLLWPPGTWDTSRAVAADDGRVAVVIALGRTSLVRLER